MTIINNVEAFRCEPNVATMGFFDGVHLGHAYLVRKMIEKAHQENKKSVVVTFDQHPRIVLQQDFQPKLLTSFEERISLLARLGCDYVVVLPFTKRLAQFSAKDFLRDVLRDKINTQVLVVGHDHRFGRYREDSFAKYSEEAEQLGMSVVRTDALQASGMTVSSSAIRHELERGNVEKANAMLGHSFLIDGTVVDGQKIGRKMNFPTANVALKEPLKILPANGVYSAKIHVKGKDYDGMLNIGIRPTVDGRADDTTVECHIFDFDDNVYGEEINVYPLNFVREERKFESIDALAAQLQKDKEHVLRLLS